MDHDVSAAPPPGFADDLLRSMTDPLLDPIFWQAERIGEPSAWWRHVPFAHWIIQAASPATLVELGTHTGVSYSAFCKAVESAGLSTRCWAVDTWQGDIHAGTYDDTVFHNFKNFHDARFAAFSGLLRCRFDEALPRFTDQSIDFLHIDGCHTYEAVRDDFQSWLPKLSARAVVLFHDTNVLQGDFGVWRLWEELRQHYPSFEFLHGHGLGVLGVGSDLPPAVATLLSVKGPAAKARLRARFAWLGERWLSETREHLLAVETSLKAAATSSEADAIRRDLEAAGAALAAARAEAAAALLEAGRELDAAQQALATPMAEAAAARLEAEASDSRAATLEIEAWRQADIAAKNAAHSAEQISGRRRAERQSGIANAMRAQAAYRADTARREAQTAHARSEEDARALRKAEAALAQAQHETKLQAERSAAAVRQAEAAANAAIDRSQAIADADIRQSKTEAVAAISRAECAAAQAEAANTRALAFEVQMRAFEAQMLQARHATQRVLDSTAWRATWPIRCIAEMLPVGVRSAARRGAKLAWWASCFKLKRKLIERRLLLKGTAMQPLAESPVPEVLTLPIAQSTEETPAPVAELPAPIEPAAEAWALAEEEPEATDAAAAYFAEVAIGAKPALRLVYVSGEPGTPGHRYRVERPAAAARILGAKATVILATCLGDDLDTCAQADVLVLWRTPWSEPIAAAVGAARKAGAKIVFDIDDLMVDPVLARLDVIDGIRSQYLTEDSTAQHFARIRQTMLVADLCIGSTLELADHMRSSWMPARVLANAFDHATLDASRLAARCWTQTRDDLLRIGYAGGSRTHQRDFALCAQAVGDALRAFPQARLVAFCSSTDKILDIEEFPALHGLADQIEWRQFVPLEQLPEELARFDINLAPLETGNQFCEAKSDLKYFEAALVGVPTIASPTGPYRRAIRDGLTGFLAESPAQWRTALISLLGNAELRARIAGAARRAVLWTHGPERQLEEMADLLDLLQGGMPAARAFERGILRLPSAVAPLQQSIPYLAPHEVLFDRDQLGVSAVTIAVPLYNYADLVTEALESAAMQTLRPLDLIVVDDRSTDSSLAVAMAWVDANAWRFNRVRVVRNNANAGLAFARNVAFDLADTGWVLPLDADNRLRPGCAAECLRVARQTGAAYVYPTIQQFGIGSDLMGLSPYDPVRLANGNYIDAMALISRAAWAKVGGYDHVPGGWEDYDLWCRFAEHGLRGEHVVGEPLAEYRVHGTSMIRTAAGSAQRMDGMMTDLQKRHPWLTVVWPLPIPRPVSLAAPALRLPDDRSHARLTELLEILRCPDSGSRLAFTPDGRALISESGLRWPLVEGRPNLFAGLKMPQISADTHISNPLPEKARALTRAATGQVLHLSAGASGERFPNVVEAEAAVFRNTDVLADAHHLPFADNAFEVVIAMNAFEHYRDPPRAAREIRRVLAPGGRVMVRTAFLQPEHEAPWHFYNCTRFGLENWFQDFETEELHVSSNFHPGYSISWLASECEAALRSAHSAQAADAFSRATLGDFISLWRTPEDERAHYGLASWSDLAVLPQGAQQRISSGFEFLGRKPV